MSAVILALLVIVSKKYGTSDIAELANVEMSEEEKNEADA